eukprot:CAMPEP_0178791128 /NCGR_PEP_ID=MMETSP0745-20121128/7824_1 /TAXON_ID=913974 /ORGANISM="Nitzschia punctata, Strain CCMP561" /LENGTH=79 /DNA_ID=CAMNT_0020449227 /DNA_START=2162 /DNA_END=2400 /DNA_ORIENTATION=-
MKNLLLVHVRHKFEKELKGEFDEIEIIAQQTGDKTHGNDDFFTAAMGEVALREEAAVLKKERFDEEPSKKDSDEDTQEI